MVGFVITKSAQKTSAAPYRVGKKGAISANGDITFVGKATIEIPIAAIVNPTMYSTGSAWNHEGALNTGLSNNIV